ncbi:MAG: phosphate ABC transporter permease subunit PstC [Actinomycetota bacterium]|nr:phosphate ABC transporter permease subunit PstC [Actinomycetota bacterium]
MKVLLTACAYLSIFTTIGIVVVLFEETARFFFEVSPVEFLTSTRWAPQQGSFGVLPLVYGTLMATLIAIAVALPVGLLTAIYLSEYAPQRLRRWLKPALEILAGVPTVVYGYFALTFITPFFRESVFPGIGSFNALAAGLIMGVMIIPTVASVSEDAIYAVPRSLREGAYALGATRRETATRVVVPAALSGIAAAVILGVSRAIGETMIVTIAMGSQANFGGTPLEGMQAMTAYIVQVVGGETPRESVTYKSIFAVGSALFLMTLALNLASYWFVRRFRETY